MKRMLFGLAATTLAVAAFAAPPHGAPPLGTVDVNVVNPVLPVEVTNADPIPVTNVGPVPSLAVGNVGAYSSGVSDPMPGELYTLIGINGPGKFVSAYVTKQGGATDVTFVELYLDGRLLTSVSMAALRNWNLTQSNPSGLMLLPGATVDSVDTMAIGFPFPLSFETDLKLQVRIGGSDTGIVQILGRVLAAED